jgi:sugar phosphate isomerase/epimerase
MFACWTEAGLRETIEQAISRCHVIQVGDWKYGDRSLPARAVPGDGVIPLKRMCEWALNAGYEGAFDLELLGPRIDQEGRVKAVGRAARYMSELLDSLAA